MSPPGPDGDAPWARRRSVAGPFPGSAAAWARTPSVTPVRKSSRPLVLRRTDTVRRSDAALRPRRYDGLCREKALGQAVSCRGTWVEEDNHDDRTEHRLRRQVHAVRDRSRTGPGWRLQEARWLQGGHSTRARPAPLLSLRRHAVLRPDRLQPTARPRQARPAAGLRGSLSTAQYRSHKSTTMKVVRPSAKHWA